MSANQRAKITMLIPSLGDDPTRMRTSQKTIQRATSGR